MTNATLNYALPSRRRITRPMVLLVISAVAVAIVGKLCWDKFVEPVRKRMEVARSFETSASRFWVGLEYPPASRQSQSGQPASNPMRAISQELELKAMLPQASGIFPQGSVLFFGHVGNGGNRRYLLLTVNRTDTEQVASVTLVARVYSAATLMQSPRQMGDAAIVPFLTFREGYKVDPVATSQDNPLLLVLTGTRDGAPFRFELSIDGSDRIHLVEDVPATSNPDAK
jgi:hypothetical protein